MIESSSVFMVSVESILQNHCHLKLRTRKNAYRSHRQLKDKSPEERAKRWDTLKDTIKTDGFDANQPITIQLLRKDGKDKIKDGHHRLGIAIALELAVIPVRFLFDNDSNKAEE